MTWIYSRFYHFRTTHTYFAFSFWYSIRLLHGSY